MTTRQVYTNTLRSRTQRTNAQGTSNSVVQSSAYPLSYGGNGYSCNGSIVNQADYYRRPTQPHSSYNTPVRSVHPSRDQLREARLDKFQSKYDHDKEVHKVKEEERRRKKLEEKLKRYKGVGELGNKLTPEKLTEDEKYDGYWASRDSFHAQYQNDSNLAQQKREEEEELNKSMEHLAVDEAQDASSSPAGSRLGGTSVKMVRGNHPLLSKMSNSQN